MTPTNSGCLTRVARAADRLRAHDGLGQDREDGISMPESLDYWDEIGHRLLREPPRRGSLE
jgi:hypothetical protein